MIEVGSSVSCYASSPNSIKMDAHDSNVHHDELSMRQADILKIVNFLKRVDHTITSYNDY